VPAAAAAQVPTEPTRLQRSQMPPQLELQQTPSTHWLDWHSCPEPQTVPFAFFA
jgi:hypothetical protein